MTRPQPSAPAGLEQLVERRSTAEQVARTLRDLILRGDYGPGSTIEETQFADAFAVSRNTMREAIRQLARSGILVRAPHHRAVVATLTSDDVHDIFHVRRLLELDAVDRAPKAGQVELGQFRLALEELRAASDSDDWPRIVERDFHFHAAIVGLGQSERVNRMYREAEAEIRLCLTLTDRWDSDPGGQMDQHGQIYELLTNGATAEAQELLLRHINDAESRVVGVLERADGHLDQAS